MIEKLLSLLGRSIESEEIKSLYKEFDAIYPKKITCTANNDGIKGKVEKDGIKLYFGRGGYSRYLKPILAKTKGSNIGMFTMIEFTKKYKDAIPFGVTYDMKHDELTKKLGKPKVVEFMGKTSTWRKNFTDKHELIVSDMQTTNTSTDMIRSITLSYIWENDLYTMEDYAKANL